MSPHESIVFDWRDLDETKANSTTNVTMENESDPYAILKYPPVI